MKKKILFINGHMNIGGAERSLLDILKHMDYDRYDVELLLLEKYGEYAEEIPLQVKVRLFDLHDTYGSLPKALLRCIKKGNWACFRMRLIMQLAGMSNVRMYQKAKKLLFNGAHYDVVVAFRPGICTDIAAFAADGKKKITWWHHGEYTLSDAEEKNYRLSCEKMDTIVAVSRSCERMLAEKLPECQSKLTVVPNMVSIQEIAQKALQFKLPTDGKKVFVSVGRLAREKHFENVIDTAKQLKAHGITDFRWYILGEGAERFCLETRIAEADVADLVFLAGSCANPFPYVARADLFVHPSYVESQGLAVLEAMALGIPCVVTKSPGLCEFVKNEVNALLTEQSAGSLASAVERILTDAALYQRIRENTKCPAQFQPAYVMEKLESMLEEIKCVKVDLA